LRERTGVTFLRRFVFEFEGHALINEPGAIDDLGTLGHALFPLLETHELDAEHIRLAGHTDMFPRLLGVNCGLEHAEHEISDA
jgi:hypothetical protein